MSNVYSLDDLRNDLDKQFAPVKITVGKKDIVLRNVFRLGKKEREEVLEAMKSFDKDDTGSTDVSETEDVIKRILSIVAEEGDALVQAIGDDLALGMKIMQLWTDATQAGEASNSPD